MLLPFAIGHYRKNLPNSKITVLDNGSTDGSPALAKALGCEVQSFISGGNGIPNGTHNEFKGRQMKNEVWQHIKQGWIITADMDEWLQVTETDLQLEADRNSTILRVQGFQMVGNSSEPDLSDLDLMNV